MKRTLWTISFVSLSSAAMIACGGGSGGGGQPIGAANPPASETTAPDVSTQNQQAMLEAFGPTEQKYRSLDQQLLAVNLDSYSRELIEPVSFSQLYLEKYDHLAQIDTEANVLLRLKAASVVKVSVDGTEQVVKASSYSQRIVSFRVIEEFKILAAMYSSDFESSNILAIADSAFGLPSQDNNILPIDDAAFGTNNQAANSVPGATDSGNSAAVPAQSSETDSKPTAKPAAVISWEKLSSLPIDQQFSAPFGFTKDPAYLALTHQQQIRDFKRISESNLHNMLNHYRQGALQTQEKRDSFAIMIKAYARQQPKLLLTTIEQQNFSLAEILEIADITNSALLSQALGRKYASQPGHEDLVKQLFANLRPDQHNLRADLLGAVELAAQNETESLLLVDHLLGYSAASDIDKTHRPLAMILQHFANDRSMSRKIFSKLLRKNRSKRKAADKTARARRAIHAIDYLDGKRDGQVLLNKTQSKALQKALSQVHDAHSMPELYETIVDHFASDKELAEAEQKQMSRTQSFYRKGPFGFYYFYYGI